MWNSGRKIMGKDSIQLSSLTPRTLGEYAIEIGRNEDTGCGEDVGDGDKAFLFDVD
jgi:hypothetical protein